MQILEEFSFTGIARLDLNFRMKELKVEHFIYTEIV